MRDFAPLPICHLLAATLGLKEKRVITGWTKTLKGKVYHYPGLIEILQQFNLVIAEVQGETPRTHYLFHVHLTPGLLSDEQLGQLPAILQKKHGELLARCQKEQEELAAKRRPPKSPGGAVIYHPNNTNITIPIEHYLPRAKITATTIAFCPQHPLLLLP